MSQWNFFDYASKDTLLEVMSREADEFLALCSDPDTWDEPDGIGSLGTATSPATLSTPSRGTFPPSTPPVARAPCPTRSASGT